MPRIGHRKREAEIREAVEAIGFTVVSIAKTRRNNHYCVTVRDDARNKFRCYTSSSCSAASCRALNNFKSDVRRMSNRAKGLID